jgi:hypothetical protein
MMFARRDDHQAGTEQVRQAIITMLHRLQDEYPVTPRPGDDWWQPARLGGSAPTPAEAERIEAERAARKAAASEDS